MSFPSQEKEYRNYYQREYRHRVGISNKYSNKYDGLCENIIPRKFNKKAHKAMSKYPGKLLARTVQIVYEDNIKKHGTLTCCLCLNPIEFGKDSLEHIVPKQLGGTNEYSNLAVACFSCNVKKSNRTYEDFKIKQAH